MLIEKKGQETIAVAGFPVPWNMHPATSYGYRVVDKDNNFIALCDEGDVAQLFACWPEFHADLEKIRGFQLGLSALLPELKVILKNEYRIDIDTEFNLKVIYDRLEDRMECIATILGENDI